MSFFDVKDFEKDVKNSGIVFEPYTKVTMRVNFVREDQQKNGRPLYKLACSVLDGEHKGRFYDILIPTTTSDKTKGTHIFKVLLQGFFNDYAVKEIKEGRGEKLTESIKSKIPELIKIVFETKFHPAKGKYQNPVYFSIVQKPTKEAEQKKETPKIEGKAEAKEEKLSEPTKESPKF